MSKPDDIPKTITIPVTAEQVARLDSLRDRGDAPSPTRTAFAAHLFERGLSVAEVGRSLSRPAKRRAGAAS